MDINQITDLNELKALIYDQLRIERQAQSNIAALENRLLKLEESSLSDGTSEEGNKSKK